MVGLTGVTHMAAQQSLVQPNLLATPGEIFSFGLLGVLRVRVGRRAYQLGMHLSVGN